MAKFKFLPLLALMCLSACGTAQPGTSTSQPGGDSSPSKSEPTSSEQESSSSEKESSSEQETSSSEKENKPNFGLSIAMPEGRALKIAQFADIHFGVEGKDWHNDKVDRTVEYMDYIVETTDPDLIVCSGDNILSTGLAKLEQFVKQMDKYKTPWTFIYGNHDEEQHGQLKKKDLHEALLASTSQYLLYGDDYSEEATTRWGNFTINVTNTEEDKLLGSIFFLDSGLHNGSGYDAITEGQINWYKSTIDELQATYSAQTGNAHQTIPSLVFSHINLPEHATLYDRARNNDGATFVIEQDLGDAKQSIADGGPSNNTGMYAAMVEKGSTKGYFVGHAHTYKFQVKDNADGIVLGFAPQIGFSKCFEDNDLARSGYVYNLESDFSFTTTEVKENAAKYGLLYSGTYEGKMTIDVETGLYSVKLEFALWNRILFSYQGKRLAVADFTGGITGSFKNTDQATWSQELYTSTGSNFIYSGSKKTTYIFSIDLEKMSLDITVWVDPDAPTKPVTEVEVTNVNADGGADSVNVWLQATEFKNPNAGSAGGWYWNGWRYFIIVDPQGKIAYAVVNPPNGYGGPNGTGYYCHPDYNNYEDNPVFEILEGFGPWVPGGTAHNQYKVKVPEGWLGITAHGAGNAALAQAFSNGERDASSDAVLNARNAYLDTLRVSYDAGSNLIKASWVE